MMDCDFGTGSLKTNIFKVLFSELQKKSMLRMLLIMLTIMDDPLSVMTTTLRVRCATLMLTTPYTTLYLSTYPGVSLRYMRARRMAKVILSSCSMPLATRVYVTCNNIQGAIISRWQHRSHVHMNNFVHVTAPNRALDPPVYQFGIQ